MAKESDWATYGMMEAPFWRNGMSPEEYEKEQEYFYKMINSEKRLEYQPLWKQNKE